MNDVDDLTEDERNLLWATGAVEQLKKWGFIEGGIERITPRGITIWDQLDMEFKPTDDGLKGAVINSLCVGMDGWTAFKVFKVLQGFRDFRDKLEEAAIQFAKDKQ